MATPARAFRIDNHPGDPLSRIGPGDLVRTGESRYPQYRVIATNDDRAWVRDAQDGADYIVPIARCRKIPAATLVRSNGHASQ